MLRMLRISYMDYILIFIFVLDSEHSSIATITKTVAALRVFLVDDSSSCRKMLREQCKRSILKLDMRFSCDYDEFADGLEVVQAVQSCLKTGTEPPDIIFIDNIMINMHGNETIGMLRQLGFVGLIVAVSGCNSTDDQVAMKEAGADVFIAKPVDPNVLFRLFQDLTLKP